MKNPFSKAPAPGPQDKQIIMGNGDVEMVIVESIKTVMLYVRKPGSDASAYDDTQKHLENLGYFFVVFSG
jgi:hypothetical protein